jgi:CheY-like chemotaxis protein
MSAPRILVIEDDGLQAMTLEDMLEDMGCEVAASFGTMAQATAWLEADGQADAALLDVNVDGEPVYPFADLLVSRRMPFCFTSGYGHVAERRFEKALVLGKPLSREALLNALRGFGLTL